MEKKFNIMDTPGYLDFISEALAALRVADLAIVVVHAQHGRHRAGLELRHGMRDSKDHRYKRAG